MTYKERIKELSTQMAMAQYKQAHMSVQCGLPMPMMKIDWESPLVMKAIESMKAHHELSAQIAIKFAVDIFLASRHISEEDPSPVMKELGLIK